MFICKLDHLLKLLSLFSISYIKKLKHTFALRDSRAACIRLQSQRWKQHITHQSDRNEPHWLEAWTALAPRSNRGVCTFNRQTEVKPKPMLSKFRVQKVKARSLWQTIQLSGALLLRLCLNEANSPDPTFNFKRWANWRIHTGCEA